MIRDAALERRSRPEALQVAHIPGCSCVLGERDDLPAELPVALGSGESQPEPPRRVRNRGPPVSGKAREPDAECATPHGRIRKVPVLEGSGLRDRLDLRGRSLVPLVVDQSDDPGARRPAQIGPPPVRAVQRHVELVVVGGLAERSLEDFTSLLDGEAIVVRVSYDVGPPEVPRLERGRYGELVFELRQRDVGEVASPSLEHLRVVAGNVLARPRSERYGRLRTTGESNGEEQAGDAHRARRA